MSLEVGVGGLRHLLLGTHGTAVVGWRAPTKVLLLQEPVLVDVLVQHACLWHWGHTTPSANSTLLLLSLPWSDLSGLERGSSWSSSTSTRSTVLSLKPTH